MSNLKTLNSIVNIRKSFEEISFTTSGFEGIIKCVQTEDLKLIFDSWDVFNDVFDVDNNESVNRTTIYNFEGRNLQLGISTGNVAYYEKFEDFIRGNKLKINDKPFYIFELDYYYEITKDVPLKVKQYLNNLDLIELIKSLSDYQKITGNILELFFYKSENGLSLNIEYNSNNLITIHQSIILELQSQFNNSPDAQERKQIFKNELIDILNKKGNTYKILLDNWEILVDSYKKSFELYLSGFSFEKIKTASLSYFHELTDRIHETIGKVSNYIFAVPIAYVLLIRYFDFDGSNLMGDFLLLIIGALFFILVWFVALKNIDESIESIEEDIEDFKSKIENNNALEVIIIKLNDLKTTKLNAQKNKVCIARVVSFVIFLIVVFAFCYIHFREDIKVLIVSLCECRPIFY